MGGVDLIKIVGAIGKQAIWHVGNMKVPVQVLDAKVAYGHAYYLIKTGAGSAVKWVADSNISVDQRSLEIAKNVWESIRTTLHF